MGHRTQHVIRLAVASTWLVARTASACPEGEEPAKAAAAALAAGDFSAAKLAYQTVTRLCPDDATAWRDLGRAAGATKDFHLAETALARANQLAHEAPDPELHFLRGDALYALARADEGHHEHDQATREIGPAPKERQPRLLLARIEIRRGHLDAAVALYAAIEGAAGPAGDLDASLAHAEVLILAHQLDGAIALLHRVLETQPANGRGLELLAWALESRGDANAEVATRARLVALRPNDAQAHFDHGRALERASRRSDALAAYQRAQALDDKPASAAAVTRLTFQLAPEIMLALTGSFEPSATGLALHTGGVVTAADRIQLGLIGWAYGATRAIGSDESRTVGALAFTNLKLDEHLELRGGVGYRHAHLPQHVTTGAATTTDDVLGAELSGVAKLGAAVIDVQSSYHAAWDEAAIAMLEGGGQNSVSASIGYPILSGRVVLTGGGLARALTLSRELDGVVPGATIVAWTGGADLVAWTAPKHHLDGEALDDRLARPAYLQDAVIVGFRHYDTYVHEDARFLDRIALAPRISLEALSGAARKVFFDGKASVEVRALAGYDHARKTKALGGGFSILIDAWCGGRLVIAGDLTTETTGVITGSRTSTSVSYHQDL